MTEDSVETCFKKPCVVSKNRKLKQTTTTTATGTSLNKRFNEQTNAVHVRYLSNGPHVSMVYRLINHAGCW